MDLKRNVGEAGKLRAGWRAPEEEEEEAEGKSEKEREEWA